MVDYIIALAIVEVGARLELDILVAHGFVEIIIQ
jgi:hypothetical protein